MKILIVEDDNVIANALKEALLQWQFEINLVEDFNDVLMTFNTFKPHLVLMDINLPTFNGFHWCQMIRKTSNVPIIFISSRSDDMDQIMAMQMGADDYIEKPFNMNVTISKIQALLRRTYDFTVQTTDLTVGETVLSIDKASLSFQNKKIDLTLTELQIMKVLFKHKTQFVSKNAIIEACWESENFIDDNTLAVNMTRLRKKLKEIGLDQFIETKKNVGYRVVAL